MATPPPKAGERGRPPSGPALLPTFLLAKGKVMIPGPEGPVVARGADGALPDVFETADALAAQYGALYVVDLDGIERSAPQLDYLQELSRGTELWVDAGPKNGGEVADVLIAGASHAVISSTRIRSPLEVRRAWKLSPELAFEIELNSTGTSARHADWKGADPVSVALSVRAIGLTDIVLSPREIPIDWGLVRRLAEGGPTWVDGTFELAEQRSLLSSGARGGIFHPPLTKVGEA
ncbi:MAG: HisA/HisF-related TIM barrel protein [Thermoplasmata archaeon]|nr:HisA/HisF-related TIM barrel protein [Thermoplasmata archaeon]